MKPTTTTDRCVEESWEQVQRRMSRMKVVLLSILTQLDNVPRPALFRRRERGLRERLWPVIEFIVAAREGPRPTTEAQAAAFVMGLHRLDETFPALVDEFHWLMEATGEAVFTG